MKLDNKQLYELLVEKEILNLYHANTGATSITFIEQGGLLSRGYIERNGLYQTPQSSDNIDKRFNVWDDVFLDTVDLHEYFKRQNLYGPILFKFSIDFLIEKEYDIWVTKDNPIYWTDAMKDNDKYFSNVSELKEKWDLFQRHKKMITIRNQDNPILFDYMSEIIVDNPNVKTDKIVFFNECIKGFKIALANNDWLINKFRLRQCRSCFCKDNYLNQVNLLNLKLLFLPFNHPEFNN